MEYNSILLTTIIIIDVWIFIGIIWNLLRKFFHKNYSFFDASFIFAYFIEQLVLLILLEEFPGYTSIWVGIFSIIVITTASFQNLMWESRNKKISKETNYYERLCEGYKKISADLKKANGELAEINSRLTQRIEKNNLKK